MGVLSMFSFVYFATFCMRLLLLTHMYFLTYLLSRHLAENV